MIFLYTINNTDVLLLSRSQHSGFVMKRLGPPPSRRGPREHLVWTTPARPHHPPVPAEQVCKKSIRSASGWTDHVSYPPGERGHWSYESQLSYEKHGGGVLWLPDEHLRRTLMLLPGADCRIGMQGAFSGPVDDVADHKSYIHFNLKGL